MLTIAATFTQKPDFLLICKWKRSLGDNIPKSCLFFLKLSRKLTSRAESIVQDSKTTN